jgi:hypothetical protein
MGIPAKITYEVKPSLDLIPPWDPRSGDHYWIVAVAFRVDPARFDGEQINLDQENIATIAGVGCYYCERAYEPRLLRRRCTGVPAG